MYFHRVRDLKVYSFVVNYHDRSHGCSFFVWRISKLWWIKVNKYTLSYFWDILLRHTVWFRRVLWMWKDHQKVPSVPKVHNSYLWHMFHWYRSWYVPAGSKKIHAYIDDVLIITKKYFIDHLKQLGKFLQKLIYV